jgi:hypothetical protein
MQYIKIILKSHLCTYIFLKKKGENSNSLVSVMWWAIKGYKKLNHKSINEAPSCMYVIQRAVFSLSFIDWKPLKKSLHTTQWCA